jgi:hypothetical protein
VGGELGGCEAAAVEGADSDALFRHGGWAVWRSWSGQVWYDFVCWYRLDREQECEPATMFEWISDLGGTQWSSDDISLFCSTHFNVQRPGRNGVP